MARAALKIGVRELAKMANVAPMTISRLENDQSGGYADTMRKIESALRDAGVTFLADGQAAVGEGVSVRT